VRLVAQTGAAIGREFSYALLRAVSHLPEEELQAALGRLVKSELVFQRGRPPDAVYSFKHALVQDVAHGSLLRDARHQLHAQIAEALAIHSPELMDKQPELFAQHYAEAGRIDKSVACWSKAGHRSAALSAMAEAAAQFQKALDQLAMLPDDLEHQRQELELALPSARSCSVSRDLPRRKWATPMPVRETCGNSWVLPQSSFKFPMGSRAITCTAANSMRRCAWTRICCV